MVGKGRSKEVGKEWESGGKGVERVWKKGMEKRWKGGGKEVEKG